jgi:hypothetical protein
MSYFLYLAAISPSSTNKKRPVNQKKPFTDLYLVRSPIKGHQ